MKLATEEGYVTSNVNLGETTAGSRQIMIGRKSANVEETNTKNAYNSVR